MDGQQIRAARERAGLTQQQLGLAVGVSLRTVGNWERGETVPQNRMARIRQVLAGHQDDHPEQSDPLTSVSDMALLAELARRLDRTRGQGEDRDSAPNTQVTVRGQKHPDGSLTGEVRTGKVPERAQPHGPVRRRP